MKLFGPTTSRVEKWIAGRNVKKLIETLYDGDGALRRRAAEGMAEIRSAEVLDFCSDNAQNPDKDIRWHVTQILGMMGTPVAMKILAKVHPPKKEK